MIHYNQHMSAPLPKPLLPKAEQDNTSEQMDVRNITAPRPGARQQHSPSNPAL